VFGRGEDYVRYVKGLRVTGQTAAAAVQAKRVYQVELDWSGRYVGGVCSCPHNADDNFCKHLVAVGLAVIDAGRAGGDEAPDAGLEAAVRTMPLDDLREMVLFAAHRDAEVRRRVQVHAAAHTGDDADAKVEFELMARNALQHRGFIDYRESYVVAQQASRVLDELHAHLDNGSADVVRPALLYTLTALQTIIGQADDSAGVIGDECQRAAELYARACRLGSPDPAELARWFVGFRANSPGWPTLVLSDVVDALDDEAMAIYRDGVADLNRQMAGGNHLDRFDVDQMLLELADHDGDVDRAVQLLGEQKHPRFGAIVERLRFAGRDEEAVAWIDRAVAEGRVSGHGGGNEFWLSPGAVVDTYRELSRIDDAIAVLRAEFARRPEVPQYQALCQFAGEFGRADAERDWAFQHARELAGSYSEGAVLVQLYLSEGDVEGAWAAADRYGPGWAWKLLVADGADARPVAAADLYRPGIEEDLRYPNSPIYPDIATRLATMAALYERGGRSADFAEFITSLRLHYRRRPALMKALDAAGL